MPDYTLAEWHRELSAPARVPTIQLLTFADWLDVEGAALHEYPPRFSEALRFIASRDIYPLQHFANAEYVALAFTRFAPHEILDMGRAVLGFSAPVPAFVDCVIYGWSKSETGRSGKSILRGPWFRATMRRVPRYAELCTCFNLAERAVVSTFWRTHFAPRTAWAAIEYAARGYCDLRPAQLAAL